MSKHYEEIPLEYYQQSWEDADHPMACMTVENTFLRVNSAFERLLGYSASELEGRSWIEFTRQSHIGGDIASVRAVIDGKMDSYQLEKDYIHKRGHTVPVVLRVRRYPRHSGTPVLLFRAESPLATATRPELQELHKTTETLAEALNARLAKLEERGLVHVGDTWQGGDKVGSSKVKGDYTVTNSDTALKIMAGVMALLASAVVWVMYYTQSIINNQKNVEPPRLSLPK